MPFIDIIKQKLHRLFKGELRFENATQYWEERYLRGYNSGSGSYGQLGQWKADIINAFIKEHSIHGMIDFGCGDGHFASMVQIPNYLGIDISETIIKKCRNQFKDDPSKTFRLLDHYNNESADLSISLDVIFHIIDDQQFHFYLNTLFGASNNYVIIYSSDDQQELPPLATHFLHRKFTTWIAENIPGFSLIQHIPNPFPFNGDEKNTSCADFYIYQKLDQ